MPWSELDLLQEHDQLYHVTFPENIARIQRLGLLPSSHSKTRIGDEAYRAMTDREGLRLKPTPVFIDDEQVLLNDQLPMSHGAARRCKLPTSDVRSWASYLDSHVFLWASQSRLARFLYARQQRNYESVVLRVDTAHLLDSLRGAVRLSSQNSGAPDRQCTARHFFIEFGEAERPTHWFDSRGKRKPVVEVALHDACLPASLLKVMPENDWKPLVAQFTMKKQASQERTRKQKA